MGYSLPGSSVHRILQASVLEWGAIAFSILSRDSTFILYLAVSTICCVVTDIHLLNLPVENKLHDSRILACFVQHYIPRVVSASHMVDTLRVCVCVCVCVCVSLGHVQLSVTSWTVVSCLVMFDSL